MNPAAVLSIMVTANTSQATAALARTDAQMKRSAGVAATTSSSMGSKIASGAKVGALAVGALGAISVKAAVDFESSFAEVRKTVDTSEKGFKRLEDQLRNLAKEIPVSVNELNDLAGQAGALGIKSKDLIKFTKTAAELGITTDLSSSDAANALARLSNVMGTSAKDFRRLGSTFVELGNKGASTEAEIAAMALRISGAGKQVGLSEADVLSFSSALASVGIEAEAGGSAISRAFITMAEAVDKGGADLANFAEVAGVSSGQFAKTFENDAAGAMVAFMEGLEGIRKSGGSVFATLEELELNEIRVRDSLLRASGAGDLFTDTLKVGNEEWKRNSALTEEAEKRYDTVAAQWQVMKNKANDLAISLGQKLLPDLKRMMDIVSNPKLTLDQKISKVGKKLSKMVEEWAPKIAEAGAKLGVALAKGLVSAFFKSDTIIQLATGAWLGTKALGIGQAKTTGKAFGKRLGKGIIIGVLLALPALGDDIYEFGQKHSASIRQAGVNIGEWFVNGLIGAVNLGIRAINDIMDEANIAAIAGVDAPNIGEIGKVDFSDTIGGVKTYEVALSALIDRMRKYGDVEKVTGKDTKKYFQNLADNTKTSKGEWGDYFDGLERGTRRGSNATDKHADRTRSDFDRVGAGLKTLGGTMDKYSGGADKNFGKVTTVSGRMKVGVGKNVTGLSSIVTQGLQLIGDNTNKALKAFGVKRVSLSLKKVGDAATGFQRGGITKVPGRGDGDKVPDLVPVGTGIINKKAASVLLEPGELKVAPEAVRRMGGPRVINSINRKIPRFASGGVAGGSNLMAPFDVMGSQPGFVPFMNFLNGQYGPIYVMSGARPGSITTSGSLSNHSGGHAVDISTTESGVSGATGPSSLGGPGAARMDALHKYMSQNIPLSKVSGDFLWRTYTGGNHYNHIHRGITNGLDNNPQEMIKFLSTLPGGSGMAGIPKVLLKGPNGPMKDYGNATLTEAWEGAISYLNSKASSPGYGSYNGNAHGLFNAQEGSDLWASVNRGLAQQAHVAGAVMMAESGGDPKAFGPPDGRGLWQIEWNMHPEVHSMGSPYDPESNARMAGSVYGDAGGWSPWVAYNSGSYQQFMQKGGIAKYAKGTKGAGAKKTDGPWTHEAIPRGVNAVKTASRIARRIQRLYGKIGKQDERISIAEQRHGLESSEAGSDLSESERIAQIKLQEDLLARLKTQRGLAAMGLRTTTRGLRVSSGTQKSRLSNMATTFKDALTDTQGLTGKGGRIFDSRLALNVLRNTSAGSTDEAQAGLLSEQLARLTAQLRVSQAQYGAFSGYYAKGGRIPAGRWGIAGENGPEMVSGPALVSPNAGGAPTINVYVDPVSLETRVEYLVDGKLRTEAKKAARRIPTGRI